MAYRKSTIVRRMLEISGADPTEVSRAMERDDGYVQRVADGKEPKASMNSMAVIARHCGFELAFLGHGETLAYAPTFMPREVRGFEGMEQVESRYTGCEMCVTGALYGYNDEAQKEIMRVVGAGWTDHLSLKSTRYLIRGSDKVGQETGKTKRVLNAKRAHVTEIIDAEEFRRDFAEATGFDLESGAWVG